MITVEKAPLASGRLSNERDLMDAASIFLRHLKEEPTYIHSAEHTPDGIAEWFERIQFEAVWFAELGATRVGVVALSRHCLPCVEHSPRPNVEIRRLMVTPEARGQKIGRALFQAALTAAKDDTPWLKVRVGSHAEQMYRRWGWEPLSCTVPSNNPFDRIIAMHWPQNNLRVGPER